MSKEFSIDPFLCPHIYASIYCYIILQYIRWLFGYFVTTCILITLSLTHGMGLHNWPSFKIYGSRRRECEGMPRILSLSETTFGFREPLSRSAVEVAIVDLREQLEPNPKFARDPLQTANQREKQKKAHLNIRVKRDVWLLNRY